MFRSLATVCLLGILSTAPGCSSKVAETDTAEVVPDPAVKPAPVPAAGATEAAPAAAPNP